jgi:serine-type D-Ala-D-Ala endopeptidase (penicillin-binding protein 7)
MKTKIIYFFLFTFCYFFLSFSLLNANESLIEIEEKMVKNNQEFSFFDDELIISFKAGTLNKEVKLVAKKISSPFNWPWNFSPLSVVYEFDLENNGQDYNHDKAINIKINYQKDNDNYKKIFFLDGSFNRWRELPSKENYKNNYVETNLHFSFARLAVLYNSDIDLKGEASWYVFKGGNFAASPDFPRGSVIRVHNTDNNKFVDVVINDYGPNRAIYPNRIIDLDKEAYKKIAPAGSGIIDIRLEPLHIVKANNDFFFTADFTVPQISAKSAILISEKDNRIFFAKDANRVAPLASLTKLVAARVFLDLGIPLEKEVVYLDTDEKYNHEFVAPWESARLRVSGGEVLTIKDLLYSSLVGSSNNTIETLVRASGLDRQEFIARMNIFAEVWGARQTNFVEPTGLSKDNVSSPQDYAIIMKEVLKNKLLRDISTTHIYSFKTVNTNRSFRVSNTNQLMRYGLLPINAAKTGFINASGYCLFSRVQNVDDNFIVVTFASENRDLSYNDHERLVNYALRQLQD